MNAPVKLACKMIALSLGCWLVSAGSSVGAPPRDLAGTFNMPALQAAYALSCDAQAHMRLKNIPPPHFEGRPREFANPENALVVYSPHFTPRQRQLAEKIFASVPSYALPIARRGGAVYVFTRRSLVEAVPGLAVEDSWFEDYGLYMAVEKRLYIPFEKGVNIRRQADGTYAAGHYVPSQREPFRIVNHETGHLIDALLGVYSLESANAEGESRLSNRADFQQALRHDLGALLKRKLSAAQTQRLGYYLPSTYEGMTLGGAQGSEQRLRREVFAELWAETQGYDSNRLSNAYPRTFQVVRKIMEFLKAQHEQAPHICL